MALAGLCGLLGAAEPSLAGQAIGSIWDAVKGFGDLALKAFWHFILWGIFGFVLGAVAGVYLWRWLRDRGWMDLPWGGYKYVRWIWPVLMVGTLSLGLSSALSVWGSGRAIKQGAREGEVFETAVVKSYSAIMVWRLGGEGEDANGTSLLDRDLAGAIAKLRDTTGKAQGVESDARKRAMEALDKQSGGGIQEWFGRKAVEFLWDEQIKGRLSETEAADFLKSIQADQSSSTEAVALLKKKIMSGVYLALDETVNSFVYPLLLTIALTAMPMLLLPLGIFWLIRWFCLRKNPDASQGGGVPPMLNDAE